IILHFIRDAETIGFIIRFKQVSHTYFDKSLAWFCLFKPQWVKGFHRTCNSIMDFWIMFPVPFAKIGMPLIFQVRNHPAPIKTGALIISPSGVRKVYFGTEYPVTDFRPRKLGRRNRPNKNKHPQTGSKYEIKVSVFPIVHSTMTSGLLFWTFLPNILIILQIYRYGGE